MNLLIDALDSDTGWTASDDTKLKVLRTNDILNYIANEQSDSLLIQAIGSANGEYVQKTFTAVDVTNYDELVLWIYSSKLKNNGINMNNLSEFKYKIDFNSSMLDFCIPLYDTFTYVAFDISDITSIDRIRVTALHDTSDYLIISSLVAVKDQIPLDIYKACKSKIEDEIDRIITSNGISVGTVTGTAGDSTITILGTKDYLARFSTIEINDGVNSETHQLWDNDGSTYKLTSMYDGDSLANSFSSAGVYLKLPVEYGLLREIILPGIIIKGNTPSPITRGSKVGKILNSYREDRTVNEIYTPQILNWNIEFHIESRSEQLLEYMATAIRRFIESQTLWVNGKRFEINYQGDPVYIEPFVPEDLVYKIVYTMVIEIQEHWDVPVELPNTATITDNIYINSN